MSILVEKLLDASLVLQVTVNHFFLICWGNIINYKSLEVQIIVLKVSWCIRCAPIDILVIFPYVLLKSRKLPCMLSSFPGKSWPMSYYVKPSPPLSISYLYLQMTWLSTNSKITCGLQCHWLMLKAWNPCSFEHEHQDFVPHEMHSWIMLFTLISSLW